MAGVGRSVPQMHRLGSSIGARGTRPHAAALPALCLSAPSGPAAVRPACCLRASCSRTNPRGSLSAPKASLACSASPALAGSIRSSRALQCAGRGRQSRVSCHPHSAAASPARPITADWKQEITWESVKVNGVRKEAELLYSLTLDVSSAPKLQEGYNNAGQYVQVKVGDAKPAFLAIASPPKNAREDGVFEFLVKAVEGSTAALLAESEAGREVQVSQVMGKGFNMEAVSPPSSFPTLLLFATGSGISPIRALIEEGFNAGERGDVRLFFGVRDLPFLPYQERFAAWKASGVEVLTVLSQPQPNWNGPSGFVQAAYQAGPGVRDGSCAGAVLCGHKGMAQDVRAILEHQGVAPDHILLNF